MPLLMRWIPVGGEVAGREVIARTVHHRARQQFVGCSPIASPLHPYRCSIATPYTRSRLHSPAPANTRRVIMEDFLGMPIEHAVHLTPGLDMLPAVRVDQVEHRIIGVDHAVGLIEPSRRPSGRTPWLILVKKDIIPNKPPSLCTGMPLCKHREQICVEGCGVRGDHKHKQSTLPKF